MYTKYLNFTRTPLSLTKPGDAAALYAYGNMLVRAHRAFSPYRLSSASCTFWRGTTTDINFKDAPGGGFIPQSMRDYGPHHIHNHVLAKMTCRSYSVAVTANSQLSSECNWVYLLPPPLALWT